MGRWWPDPTPAGGALPPGNHGRKPPPPPKTRHNRKPPPPPPREGRKEWCDCAMAASVRSLRQGRYRLAARYVRMAPRYVARRFA